MPWRVPTQMSQQEEFVQLALQPGVNRRELCRRFNISPKTGYKWLRRYQLGGREGLKENSRRPHRSPARTDPAVEREVIRLRAESLNCWGGRKLARQLVNLRGPQLAPSTVTSILRRAGLLNPVIAAAATPWQRFERAGPNELWQMDLRATSPWSAAPAAIH